MTIIYILALVAYIWFAIWLYRNYFQVSPHTTIAVVNEFALSDGDFVDVGGELLEIVNIVDRHTITVRHVIGVPTSANLSLDTEDTPPNPNNPTDLQDTSTCS